MPIKYHKISLIIISNNNEKEIFRTVKRLITDLQDENDIVFEIILIDNASRDGTKQEMLRSIKLFNNFDIRYIFEDKKGVSSAIYKGLENAKYSSSCVLTGHDVWDTRCLAELIRLHDGENIILGYRINKRGNRPILKYISSNILIISFNALFKLSLLDLNGLLVFNTKDFLLNMKKSGGHAHVIYPLVRLTRKGVPVLQYPALMNKNHHKRETRKIQDSFPKLKPIYSILKAIIFLVFFK